MHTSCKKLAIALRIVACSALLFLAQASLAQQTVSVTETARWKSRITEIKPTPGASDGIPMLTWTPEEIWVDAQGPVNYARIRWKITEPYKGVSINGKTVEPNADGSFEVNFGFTHSERAFKLVVIDQSDKSYEGFYKILDINEAARAKASQKKFRFNAGAGLTSIRYAQTNVDSFNEMAFTVKAGMSYRLIPDKLDLSVGSFLNAAVLSSTSPIYSIRYLGLNFRAGYHLITAPSAFRVVINGGFYYNTSFGSIGFSNMYGPQLYPEISYIFNNGHAILSYAKYSPALFQQGLDFGTNKEVATGLYYIFPISTTKRMSIGFDISKLDLATESDSASTTTFSLSTGISF